MYKNSSAKYYQKKTEKLQEKAHESYQNLSEEEKSKKQQNGREWFKNFPGEEKQRPVEYGKNIAKYGNIKMVHK